MAHRNKTYQALATQILVSRINSLMVLVLLWDLLKKNTEDHQIYSSKIQGYLSHSVDSVLHLVIV